MEMIGQAALLHLPHPPSSSSTSRIPIPNRPPSLAAENPKIPSLSNHLLSLAIAITLNSPLLPCYAIPSLNSNSNPNSLSPTTPFSQSKNLQVGLLDGKIRPCPSTNPGCVSTNPKSSSFSFPWTIPDAADSTPATEEFAVKKLEQAIQLTQKNPKIRVTENTPYGRYLEAEVDGFFGTRDILEFLVKGDVVTYRCVATKVTFVYPFTTAIGDSKGQQERLDQIIDQLGWFSPSFDSMG
ncbi:unnamed protein product [Linum tenue]|uniref:Thylakoid lumenal 17.9 kDa protein, chloroplastic n=1 Tax=Linum tenue TaxID=586396 RepID=A0AAV0HVD7_9ROSI|nr:unnamed protein product [Linum tenue]